MGVFEKISVEYIFPHFLPFNLLSKSLILSDLQWLAKLVLVVQLWSLHKISGQKNNFVEGEWWTVEGVWPCGNCPRLQISSSLGSSPGWGHCVVFWDTTLYSLSAPLSTQVYKWVLANVMLGVTLRWISIPSRGEIETLIVSSCYRKQDKLQSDRQPVSYADFTSYIGELLCNKYLFERCNCSLINAFVSNVEFFESLWMAHSSLCSLELSPVGV